MIGFLMTDIYLEHYGKKGMRWGYRKERNLQSLKRVGAGKGSAADKINASSQLSLANYIRGGGLKGASRRKAQRLEEVKERTLRGEATTMDFLREIGSRKFSDLVIDD